MGFRVERRLGRHFLVFLMLAGCSQVETAAPPPPEYSIPPESPKQPKKTPASVSPKTLVGKSEQQLIAFLGQPGSVREEPPAMVWQYVGRACKVDIFFYFDIKSQDFRSLAYKFYKDSGSTQKDSECLGLLQTNAASIQKKN
jgi:hypothetical protein